MNWEYKVFTFIPKVNDRQIPNVDESLINLLNENGSDGWELVSAIQEESKNDTNIKLFFKRHKE
ncbi:DUF4177 domain-containing protein [Lysinibacillus agricola]|uniref:DUF4177 domain-containing protein n=1 Tax=Lysinibacillus agricola TaxID=2590012 RepID=A0ABX7ARL0_9BACI|nr:MULTISPECIES: DUF4177 domain-containing protein [Lysinibacillus]KOS60909.1 hypothetical protein AN161_20240 [Lysinibacillus sp. FJAT-14222]QQP11538.1 DUF4177 domain-containing protein [Lysinibacillus agricola]